MVQAPDNAYLSGRRGFYCTEFHIAMRVGGLPLTFCKWTVVLQVVSAYLLMEKKVKPNAQADLKY